MALGVKTGGRRKGTPNKVTTDMREALASLASKNINKLQAWLDDIKDPAQRFKLFLDLCEYHIPKLARTELTGEGGGPLQIGVVRFSDLPPKPVDTTALPDERMGAPGTGLAPVRTLLAPPKR